MFIASGNDFRKLHQELIAVRMGLEMIIVLTSGVKVDLLRLSHDSDDNPYTIDPNTNTSVENPRYSHKDIIVTDVEKQAAMEFAETSGDDTEEMRAWEQKVIELALARQRAQIQIVNLNPINPINPINPTSANPEDAPTQTNVSNS